MKQLPKIPVAAKFIPFEGGLDTETPILFSKTGRVRSAQNVYQGMNGGYITFQGYERIDGRISPSLAGYATLSVVLNQTVTPGSTVTDGTATGIVLAVGNNLLALAKVSGIFTTGNIRVGVTVVGTCTGPQINSSAPSRMLAAQYKSLAADVYRADILAIPGSGPVRGVWFYKDKWYGFRNNAGGTATVMYVSSSGGWVAVALGQELNFTLGGTYEPQEGDTVVGETSGATAVLKRVVLRDGTWAAKTAVGKFIFASHTGTFVAETLRVGGNLHIATISGNALNIAFSNPGGQFEFRNASFTGSHESYRMYGVDGANRGFEFDGIVFVPIETGMSIYPSHLIEHKYHLFYSFLGSAQHSAPGMPYQWTPVSGADELGLSDDITGFTSQPSSDTSATLAIFTKNSIGMLYGTSTLDWNLALYKRGAGAIEWTQQFIGNTFSLDDRGITKLQTTQAYGNFSDATVSQDFQSWLKTKKTQVTASCVSMDKNLYCLFFYDKSALFCTVKGGEVKAAMPMLFEHRVTCICATEDSSGNEIIVFGDENGYVHQMFMGTSMDGLPMEWRLKLIYDHLGGPTVVKRFRKSTLECAGNGYAEFRFGYSLWYGSGDVAQSAGQLLPLEMGLSTFDSGVEYDSGVKWDGKTMTPSYFDMSGSGVNISLELGSRSTFYSSLKFSGAMLQYSQSRETR